MFDAITLTSVVDELTATIVGGRVQRVLLLDELALGLEVYADHRRHQLLISAHARDCRIHLVEARLTSDRERVTPLLLLLRKYVRGGHILAVEQPPLERTVRLSIAKHLPLDKPAPAVVAASAPIGPRLAQTADDALAEPDEELDADDDDAPGYDATVSLIVEIMGRHSNIVLVDAAGRILDSIKRVPATVNRYRTVLPRRSYVPPPEQAKADPRRVDLAWWLALVRAQATINAPLLVQELRGISPQVAREVLTRAFGAAPPPADAAERARQLQRGLAEIIEPYQAHRWAAHVYREQEHIVAFSPLALASYATHAATTYASISAAIETAFGQSSAVTGHHQARSKVLSTLEQERDRVRARRAALEDQLRAAAAAERLRESGEMIYAYIHSLTPGQPRLEVDGLTIELDPSLTAVANAQRYFDRYRRAQAAAANLPALVAEADLELAYIDQLAVFAEHAESFGDLQAIEAEWQARAQPGTRRRAAGTPRAPRRLTTPQGHQLLIGRNGVQNDAVTFDLAGPDDLWLHARGLPGAHVILRAHQSRGEPDPRVIEAAAGLAAYYSPARAATAVEVDVTARRWVRKVKGGPPGLVTYQRESTVRVAPRSEADLRTMGLLAP